MNTPSVMYFIAQGNTFDHCADQFPSPDIKVEDTERYIKESDLLALLDEIIVPNRSAENMLFTIKDSLIDFRKNIKST